jgi:hypothetical protein
MKKFEKVKDIENLVKENEKNEEDDENFFNFILCFLNNHYYLMCH